MESSPPLKKLTHSELCSVMRNSGFSFSDRINQLKVLNDFVSSTYNLDSRISSEEEKELQKKVATFFSHANGRYENASRKFDRFLSKNSEFLENGFELPHSILDALNAEPEPSTPEKASASKRPKFGRRSIPFEEKSTRAQQYASAKVRELHEPGAIVLAASQQPTTLGQLVKKTKSPSGRTAGLALKAVKSPGAPGILDLFRDCVVLMWCLLATLSVIIEPGRVCSVFPKHSRYLR